MAGDISFNGDGPGNVSYEQSPKDKFAREQIEVVDAKVKEVKTAIDNSSGRVEQVETLANAAKLKAEQVEGETNTLAAKLAETATKADVTNINNAITKIKNVYNDGTESLDLFKKNFMHVFNVKYDNTVLTRVTIDVLKYKAGELFEITIYDASLNKVASTGKQEVFIVGLNDCPFPYTVLNAGDYYLSISAKATDLLIRGNKTKGYIVPTAYPSATKLTTIYEQDYSPYFELQSYDLQAPTGFEFQNRTQYRIFCKSDASGKVYAWNTLSGKICVSENLGVTFSDLMPLSSGNGVWSMQIDDTNNKIYYTTMDGKVFKSSGLTASDTFTNITSPNKNPKAYQIPSGFKIWKGWLWVGEYSGYVGELDNAVNVHKYNLSTGEWFISKTFTDCRHVHSFTSNGSSALYVTLGDANYGANVGIHRLTTINATGEDTWTKWTSVGGNFTDNYPVDNVYTTLNGTGVLLGAGDRPKLHLTTTKALNVSPGNVNINARLYGFKDSGVGETVRNVILDDDKNCYYVTAETDKPRICVSPYPWTQSYILKELTDLSVLTTPITKAGDWIMFHTFRFHVVKFPTVASTITIEKPNYLFKEGEISTFSSIANTSNGTANNIKNATSLLIQATSTSETISFKSGFTTSAAIDLTDYKAIIVEGEFVNCTGNNKFRIKVHDTNAVDISEKEIINTNQNSEVIEKFTYSLDVSAVTGVKYIQLQSVVLGIGTISKIKIKNIALNKFL